MVLPSENLIMLIQILTQIFICCCNFCS